MRKYDVVIIGSGPAGSTAGYILASKGLDVLIVEKEKHPRKKICGGLLTEKTLLLIYEIFGDNDAQLKNRDIIDYSSYEYELILKNGERKKYTTTNGYYFVKRDMYDYYLVKKSVDVGAELIENNKITNIKLKNNTVLINNHYVKYDYLISADGVNSIIRNKYFLSKIHDLKEWYYNLGITIQIIVERENISPQIYHPQMYFTEIKEGYAWMFPNKDQMILGIIGILGKKEDIKKTFFNFINKFEIKKDQKIDFSLLPYGYYINNIVKNNILLTGDAAGLVDPFTGEGIYYAQKSGILASQTILGNIEQGIPLSKYQKDIENEIISNFQYSLIRRKLYFNNK